MIFSRGIRKSTDAAFSFARKRKSSLLAFALISGGAMWAALLAFYIASVLPPDEFGSYAVAISIMIFLSVYASHNNGSTIIRHLSHYNSTDIEKADEFRGWAIVSTLKRSFLLAFIGLPSYYFYSHYIDASLGSSIYYAICGVLFVSLSICVMAMLRCQKNPVKAFFSYYFLRYIFFIVLVWLFFSFYDATASAAVNLEVFSYFCILIVLAFFSRKMNIIKSVLKYPGIARKKKQEWEKKGFRLTKATLSQQFLGNVDIVIVGIFFGIEAAGLYAIASKVSKVVVLGNKAINEYVAPEIALAYEKEDIKRIKKVAVGACFASLIIALMIVAVLVIAKSFLFGMLGPDYDGASTILWVFIAGQLFNSATGPTGIILNMTDGEAYQTSINVISIILMLSMFSVCAYAGGGALSAAAVYSLVLIISNTLKLFYIKKTIGIWLLPRMSKDAN